MTSTQIELIIGFIAISAGLLGYFKDGGYLHGVKLLPEQELLFVLLGALFIIDSLRKIIRERLKNKE